MFVVYSFRMLVMYSFRMVVVYSFRILFVFYNDVNSYLILIGTRLIGMEDRAHLRLKMLLFFSNVYYVFWLSFQCLLCILSECVLCIIY